jgi:branched-chain amino acid transport system permease protein
VTAVLAAKGATMNAVEVPPEVVRQVLSQPLFILGVFSVVEVYFAPSFLTGLGGRLIRKAGTR